MSSALVPWRLVPFLLLFALKRGWSFTTTRPTKNRGRRLATRRSFEEWTVPELKEFVKQHNLHERGLFTKLKRKQDLIHYLEQHHKLQTKEEDKSSLLNDNNQQDAEIWQSFPKELSLLNDNSRNNQQDAEIWQSFPKELRDTLERRNISELLPIQRASYAHIVCGRDTILSSPTGSGKTYAFCWPLCARIVHDPLLQCKGKGKHSSEKHVPVSPRILVLVPSRELARQVGKELDRCTHAPVATVFGGVPLDRHASLVRKGGGAHVMVSTPGRLRELVRERFVDYQNLRVLVLDEADSLLDKRDSPDVTAILDHINEAVGNRPNHEDQEYQLVLSSATINSVVREFAKEMMDMTEASESFVSVDAVPKQLRPRLDKGTDTTPSTTTTTLPSIHYWYTPAKTFVRPSVTIDLISSLAPQLCIVFVPTKAETESTADTMQQKLFQYKVRTLHGDMSQAQRSRTISLLRKAAEDQGSKQILVATDVASRGLDLPNVDLVVQFGIPRIAGKEGTYNVELFTHRTGRAGRMGMSKSANTVMLYDPAVGEGLLLEDLVYDVDKTLGVQIQYRPIPSSLEIVEASYNRAIGSLVRDGNQMSPETLSYFRDRLVDEEMLDLSSEGSVLDTLSLAMALLADLDPSITPIEPQCSLLTGDRNDRTVEVSRTGNGAHDITPPLVTEFCKAHQSGKLGRMTIRDGIAVFDLPVNRAKRLIETVACKGADTNSWKVALANQVPDPR